MSELNLTDTITEAYNELEPTEVDNLVVDEDEDLVDISLENSDEELEDDSETEDEDTESEDEVEEGEEESDDNVNKHVVKVDGEELEVTLDELKSGYSRQAHFTKSMQALKDEREAFVAEAQQFVEQVESVQSLDAAWESNPVSVLTNLFASTENPEYALGLVIKELAASNLFSPEALQYFGIDEQTKQTWTTEAEMDRLRNEVAAREHVDQQQLSANQKQIEEQKINQVMNEFENQITNIIAGEGLDFPSAQDRLVFKTGLLSYARDNNILDLNKAYAAMQYEKMKSDKSLAVKRVESGKKKSATKVISKGGAGQSGVSRVGDKNADLRSVIESTMKDLNF